MTSFGLCKVFHYKYNTTGHNFTGHYYVLHLQFLIKFLEKYSFFVVFHSVEGPGWLNKVR